MIRKIGSRAGILALILAMCVGLAACDKSSSAGLAAVVGAAGTASTVAADAPTTGPPATSVGTCQLVASVYPDPACSPGAINPRVTQDNIGQTICVSGWSSQERHQYFPSSTATKKRVLVAYGLSPTATGGYELDHRVPIEVGGDPANPLQFFPEPWDGPHGAHAKDRLENQAHDNVCDGTWTLAYAQSLFMGPTPAW